MDCIGVDAQTETITIMHGTTPTGHCHTPSSVYAQFYTPPIIGPGAWLMWCRCNEYLPADPSATVELAWAEFTRTLGSSPGRGARILARLVQFHLVEQLPDPGHFAIRRGVPTLRPAQLERLAVHCPQLVAAHANIVRAHAA